jgi:hypothetical protein
MAGSESLHFDHLYIEMVADALGSLAAAEQAQHTAKVDEAIARCEVALAPALLDRTDARMRVLEAVEAEFEAADAEKAAKQSLSLLLAA